VKLIIFLIIIIILFLALIASFFLIHIFRVPDSSMEPGLGHNQYLVFKKYFRTKPNPKRGDIILYRDPKSETIFVGRVILLPSEEFAVSNGSIYIKEKEVRKLDEPYLNSEFRYKVNVEEMWSKLEQTQYIVLPDNRQNQIIDFKKSIVEQRDILGILMASSWYPTKCSILSRCSDNF